MSRQLNLLKAKKQYNRYPGLLPIIKLENFLLHNPRYKNEIPFKTMEAILYSVKTQPYERKSPLWQIVKKSWPTSFNWKNIGAYGNEKTLNIKLIDFSILYNKPQFLDNYPHIRNRILREIT